MSDAEFQQMTTTGRVVESTLSGVTNVIVPASRAGYSAAAAGNHYVEFEVEVSRVVVSQPPPPWGKIYGPGHLFARTLGITDMPQAVNARKLP
jgi:hypothetical protein